MTLLPGVAPRLSVVIALTCSVSAFVAQPARAYRPFDGTDASVAEPHLIEVEVGPLGYRRVGSQRLLVAPEVVLNYGTGSGFEFVLEGSGIMLLGPDPESTPPEIDDLAFSAKTLLRRGVLQDRKGPSIATEEELLLPTAGEPGTGAGASLILSQRWPNLGLHVNAGVSRTRAHEFGRFFSAIVEGPERWPVRPVAELVMEGEGAQTLVRGLLGGVIWQTRQGLTMDAAIRTSQGDEHEFELRSGFSWRMQLPPPRGRAK